MSNKETLICPNCNHSNLKAKREVTYVYTYEIENAYEKEKSKDLPFLFDNREKLKSKEYLQCENCKNIYELSFFENKDNIDLTILQKAVRCDNINNPEFLG